MRGGEWSLLVSLVLHSAVRKPCQVPKAIYTPQIQHNIFFTNGVTLSCTYVIRDRLLFTWRTTAGIHASPWHFVKDVHTLLVMYCVCIIVMLCMLCWYCMLLKIFSVCFAAQYESFSVPPANLNNTLCVWHAYTLFPCVNPTHMAVTRLYPCSHWHTGFDAGHVSCFWHINLVSNQSFLKLLTVQASCRKRCVCFNDKLEIVCHYYYQTWMLIPIWLVLKFILIGPIKTKQIASKTRSMQISKNVIPSSSKQKLSSNW